MQGPFAKNASWQLAACLCTLRLPCHGPSWLLFALPCSFKSEENARTIRQKVLRPPAGTLRGPTCSFTCVLQVKLALGLKNPQFLQQLLEGPKGPPGGPQEASKRPPCSHAPKRPPRGPQEAQSSQSGPSLTSVSQSVSQACHKRGTSVSQACHKRVTSVLTHGHTCSRMFTHAHTWSHMLTHVHPSSARRGSAGRHVHTCLHMIRHLHTSSRLLAHDHTYSHMLTHVHTC